MLRRDFFVFKRLVCAENIKIAFGEQQVLDFERFQIYEGNKIGLIGANGTGKTTLLNCIIAREQVYVVPGAKIGYLRQNFADIDFNRTVLETVMEVSIQKPEVARTILARLLLTDRDIGKKVSELSGGERMKLAFARLLVSDVNMLILDEPTNYMDMPSLEALEKLLQEYEGTMIFVSHDMDFIKAVATDALQIYDRKLIPITTTDRENHGL